jgi:hypothetical protein
MKMLMSKQKSKNYSRANVAKPFDYRKVKNPSEFIQRKYGDPANVKRFDYCKAQQKRQAGTDDGGEAYSAAKIMIEEGVSAEEAVRLYEERAARRREVMRPEYWGLSWDDLTPVGNWYVTADGLRFPPVPWFNPKDGKTYWGLACCGGKPEAGKEKQRYKMLYFKEGEVPDFETNTFGDTAAKIKTKADPKLRDAVDTYSATIATRVSGNDYTTEAVDRRTRRGIVTDEKTIKGVKLKGTNQTLAKSDVSDSKYARAEKVAPTFTKPKPKKPTADEVARVARVMGRTAVAAPQPRRTNIPTAEEENAAPARRTTNVVGAEEAAAGDAASMRERIRLAYNAADGAAGTDELVRLAVRVGVPSTADLRTMTRAGVMKRIMKYAPRYDINTGSRKMANGDIAVSGPGQ